MKDVPPLHKSVRAVEFTENEWCAENINSTREHVFFDWVYSCLVMHFFDIFINNLALFEVTQMHQRQRQYKRKKKKFTNTFHIFTIISD